jgi:hypothetical protein
MLNTEAAMDRRWAILQEALASPVAMAELIEAFSLVLNTREASTRKRIAAGHPIGNDGRYFRWHDAGDLASVEHLDAIVQIAVNCPRVSFWLPTRESKIVRAWCRANGVADPIEVAPNLVCRGSAAMIDGRAPDGFRRPGWSSVARTRTMASVARAERAGIRTWPRLATRATSVINRTATP